MFSLKLYFRFFAFLIAFRLRLGQKHPKPQPQNQSVLIDGERPQVQEVIFEEINGPLIQDIAKCAKCLVLADLLE